MAAGGNCVVARRGGEQPEADLRSQTKVNPIRFTTTTSLRATGEVCRMSGNRFLPHPSSTGEKRVVVDGWGENAGKVSCGSVESCPGRNPCKRSRAAVRAAIVVMKRGNARGAKGGRKRNHNGRRTSSYQRQRLPYGLEKRGQSALRKPSLAVVCRIEIKTGCQSCDTGRTLVPASGGRPARDESVKPRLESRVREIRTHGSEGGVGQINAPFLPLSLF